MRQKIHGVSHLAENYLNPQCPVVLAPIFTVDINMLTNPIRWVDLDIQCTHSFEEIANIHFMPSSAVHTRGSMIQEN